MMEVINEMDEKVESSQVQTVPSGQENLNGQEKTPPVESAAVRK